MGNFEQVEKDYKSNLEIEPSDYWTLRMYTLLLIMLKREEDAKILLNQFEDEYPEDRFLSYNQSEPSL